MRLTAGMVCLAACLISVAAAAAQPNIVFIVADDMGYADLGVQGAKGFRTPHLDQLAADGTRFTHFYVAQAVCTASRSALMTGCYPNRLGMHGAYNHTSRDGIADTEWLLPEMLHDRGYATAGMGKWHLGTRLKFHPLRHGFDEWFGIPYSNDNTKYHPTLAAEMPPLPLYEGEKVIELDPDQSQFTRSFTERAIDFIERQAARPFFLYLPHVMPHVPIFASEKFRGRSQLGLYGDVLEELDWSVGEILSTLRRLKLEDNTIVVFISDNGPFLSYGEHAGSAAPLREGKLTTFEGGVRVPCLVRWPGHVPAGRVCDEPFMGIDWLPTLTEIVGGKPPQLPIDGRSAKKLLLAEPEGRSPHEAYFFYSGTALQAVRSGPWKLHFPHPYITTAGEPGRGGKPSNHGNLAPASIQQSGVEGIATRHGYRIEQQELALYHLTDDPGEQRNVASQHTEVVKRLAALAEPVRRDLGDSLTKVQGAGLRSPGVDSLPNIILMMGDDHGWEETGYHGHPHVQTPVLDEMARTGLRFERFYSAHPSCSPTRASFLTGRHPNRMGTFAPGWSFRPEEITLAHVLRQAGYHCGHFGKWHVGAVKKESPVSPGAMGFQEWLSHDNFFELDPSLSRNGGPPRVFPGESSEVLVDEAIRFIDNSQQTDKPFFTVIWFGSPHEPYSGLPADLAIYDDLPAKYSKKVQLTSNETGGPITRPQGEVLRERYAEITAMDRAIGKLRKHLATRRLRDNTLVFYCGDNGTSADGALRVPHRGVKSEVYEGGILVPGLIEWPARIPRPIVSPVRASTSDLLPTVCALVGQTPPKRPLDGVDLTAALDGNMTERPNPLWFWEFNTARLARTKPKPYLDPHLQEGTTPLKKLMNGKATRDFTNWQYPAVDDADHLGPRAIINGRHKLVIHEAKGQKERRELFDLNADPGEKTNLIDQHPELAEQLQTKLRQWQQSVLQSLTGADYRMAP